MQDQATADRAFEWLDHVQPVGLVLARSLLKSLGLQPERQGKGEEDVAAGLLNADPSEPALSDPWAFFERVLGWQAVNVAGAPGGPQLDDNLSVAVAEYDTTLAPTWAVRGTKGELPWQLLVRVEDTGIDPDRRAALKGWEATPHQRFERLLRDTQVHAGVLVTDQELRLVYAPRGETSGWIVFPLRPLGTVAGRSMLGGLKLALGSFRLFNDSSERRLPALLRNSREAQATVSTHLSAQVLGALYELLRGLHSADPKLIGDLARRDPQQLYEGLLSVLLRLVFILYAEDRDLIPSHTDGRAKALYEQGYSVRGLFEKLSEDEARYPDTMNERVGGWGRLLALFRLVHGGHKSGWIKGRGGKLFHPDVHPFLEGRTSKDETPHVLSLSDGALLRILRGLLIVDGERLSYRTLDVEQVGSVYETVMGFTVILTGGPSLAIKAGKNNKTPVFVDLAALLPLKPAARIKDIKEKTGRKLTGHTETKVKQAKSIDDLIAALDNIIDERGSPVRRYLAAGTPILQPTDERRRTGSHYTPRSLTEPIVRHALEPAFERIGDNAMPDDILALKVCDPAMGSGAFLVEACRMLASRLVKAWEKWPETKPTIPPDEDEELHARRLVAQRCLYGVDKNPMATDLAKLSLWLATLARDHEFTFVDHALKTGDSLVGLSLDQIAATHWDADQAPTFAGEFVKALLQRASVTRSEIQTRGESASEAELSTLLDNVEAITEGARLIGDGILSCFFAEDKPRKRTARLVEFQKLVLSHLGKADWIDLAVPYARELEKGDHPVRPFHWQLEVPEVFEGEHPGFDAIVGNPPFAGKNTIAAGTRAHYPVWLQTIHPGAHGNSDIVAHFFRRAFGLLRTDGTLGLIATNTIGQGDTRTTGLAKLLASGGTISHATRRLRWPGEAAVVVSVVHIRKGKAPEPKLDGRVVSRISAFLIPGNQDLTPLSLAVNSRKSFQGSILLGSGFLFDDVSARDGTATSIEDMELLIEQNAINAERILPCIGGEEVNNDPEQRHSRFAIDLNGFTESQIRTTWPVLTEILERLVKPARGSSSTANWWEFERSRADLYEVISGLRFVLATNSKASPHFNVARLPARMIFTQNLNIFAHDTFAAFCSMQARIHELWARFLGTTLKDDLTYTVADCYRTFPFPSDFASDAALEIAGRAYHDHRAQLMIAHNEGLTKIYNRFHKPSEKRVDILKLRELHAAMDAAVLRAYSWDDIAQRAVAEFIELPTDFGKKTKYRLSWPSEIQDEVLKRLLALNAERAETERRAGVALAVTDGNYDPETDPEDEYDEASEDEDEDS